MKLNYRRVFFIGLAFLSIAGFWQMYDNMIPLILQNTFGLGETMTGVIMALDNVLALFLLPIVGSLSDRTSTRIGKRTPYILAGTVLSAGFLMVLSYAEQRGSLMIFAVTLLALLISMGLYRSPAVALMPDLTPPPLRSKANAVINLMGAVGGIYALLMIKLLVKKGDRPDYQPLFVSIAALMIVAVAVLMLTIKERKLSDQMELEKDEEKGEKAPGQESSRLDAVTEKMRPEVKRSLIFLLLSVFLWFTAYNAVTTAFSRYATVVWKMEGGGFADCLMIATAAAIVSYIPIGQISAKIGRKKTILAGIVLMSVCYFGAFFAKEYHPLINVAFGAIGVGWAAINVNSYPMVVEMGKGSDVGKFTGTYYTFSMAAQIITPVLSGVFLENISYQTLFPYAFFFSTAALLTMKQVKHGDSRPLKRKGLENFDTED